MAKNSSVDQQTRGDVILDRIAGSPVPAALKSSVTEFKTAHAALRAANKTAESTRVTRDDALDAVTTADATLDVAVLALGDKLAGAQLGARKNPFEAFSKLPPGKVIRLAFADEVKEVLALTAKVKKAKPPADVAKAVATCEKLAAGVTSALGKVSKPQAAYAKAIATRETLVLGWTNAYSKLRTNAAAAWFSEPATFKSVFAPPERVQAPVHKRAKKAKTPPVPPAAPAAPTTT